MAIDEYVFDPSQGPSSPDFSILRGLFIGTSKMIGRDDPDEVNIDEPIDCCGIGIRGSVDIPEFEEFKRKFAALEDPPYEQLGTPVAELLPASPAYLSTFIEVPDDPFTLAFRYAFFDPENTLSVFLGGIEILAFESSEDIVGEAFSVSLEIDWEAITTELLFVADGPAGSSVLIWDILAPGVSLFDYERWFGGGHGDTQFGWLATEEQLAEIDRLYALQNNGNPIPEPATLALMGLGLAGIGYRRHRSKIAA